MGLSLTVFGFSELNKSFDLQSFTLEKQNTFDEIDEECVTKLGMPKTIVTKGITKDNVTSYSVRMGMNILKKEILVYWDKYENEGSQLFKEYQPIEKFKISIDRNTNYMYCFIPKDIASVFVRRLIKERLLRTKPIVFDFTKIYLLNNVDRVWGLWQDKEGNIVKEAAFGPDIKESDVLDWDLVTTVYINYIYGNEVVQLCLSKEGRISTLQKQIDIQDIIYLFKEVYSTIKK